MNLTAAIETTHTSDQRTFRDSAIQLQLLQESNGDTGDFEDKDEEGEGSADEDEEMAENQADENDYISSSNRKWLELLARDTYGTVDGVPSCQIPLCPLPRHEKTLYCQFCGTSIDVLSPFEGGGVCEWT